MFSLLIVLVLMAERPKYQATFQFKNVQLLKDQVLGIGAYGKVCKAKCDDLLCAAKIIHSTLFDPTALHQIAPQREHRLPIRRFEQECEFMSAIRHPNIVQYLGMFGDPKTCLPVLLMELMDDSLTHFLESSTQPIPYHIQVNICHDIALALSFLHSNNIIHRDLSSNNVLLRGNVLAKVTDFGMAGLSDINPPTTRFSYTMCPGTDVYMPPEAVQDEPVYTEKIDCFSFGVITVQILTRLFPRPRDQFHEVDYNHHQGLPRGTMYVRVSEIDRRQNHISQVDPNHPLLIIALESLKDQSKDRPSAQQISDRLAVLKDSSAYSKGKVINVQDIHGWQLTMKEKECEIKQLRQQLQEVEVRDSEKDARIAHAYQIIEHQDQVIAGKGIENKELDQAMIKGKEKDEHEKVKIIAEKENEIQQLKQQLHQATFQASGRDKDRSSGFLPMHYIIVFDETLILLTYVPKLTSACLKSNNY